MLARTRSHHHPRQDPASRPARTAEVAVIASTLIAGLLTFGSAGAVTVGTGMLGGFEVDGNLVSGTPANLDWDTVGATVVVDDTADSGFTQGSKELKPGEWGCGTGGASPNKANIVRSYISTRIMEDRAYLDLSWVREGVSGQGDVHLNFEFNQLGTVESPDDFTPGACPILRTADDLLVTYDFPGGSAEPHINLYAWEPLASPTTNEDGVWRSLDLQAEAARAAVNQEPVTDPVEDGTIDTLRFGEATIDLLAALPPGFLTECNTFGFVNIRSRSSGESITSALQDKLPTTAIDLDVCGEILLRKLDDHDPARPLAGALFGLFDDAATTGQPVGTCTSGADGLCAFGDVKPGTYWAREIQTPADHTIDPRIEGPITVAFLESVDLRGRPFVNPRDTGHIRIVKELGDETGSVVTPADPGVLDGTTFLVYRDTDADGAYDLGEETLLWPAETRTARCTITGGTGACDVGPLPTGNYRVTETIAPPFAAPRGDIDVVVTTTSASSPVVVAYVNSLSPLNIQLSKDGPARVHAGDTVTYIFDVSTTGPRLYGITVDDLGDPTFTPSPARCDGSLAGPVRTGGNVDDILEPGEVWRYTCDYTTTEADPDVLANRARVTGTDDYGRTVTDTDDHLVEVLRPAITLDKKVDGNDHKPVGDALEISLGDTVHYTVLVTNTGNASLAISSLSDSLRSAFPTTCSLGLGDVLAVGGTVQCSYSETPSTDRHNVASVTGVDVLGGPGGTVSASDETFVAPLPSELSLMKIADRTTIDAGDTARFSITIGNGGAGVARDVTLTDPLPPDLTWELDGDFPPCSITAGTLDCALGDMNPGGSFTVVVKAPTSFAACATYPNTATADASNTDPVTSSAIIECHIPELLISKTTDTPQVSAGDEASFSMSVTNHGSGIARGAMLRDTLPGGLDWQVIPDAESCAIADTTLTCDIGDLQPGGSFTVAVSAPTTSATCGVLENVVTADADNHIPVTDSATVTVDCPGLQVLKVSGDPQISAGDTARFSITVVNRGPGIARDVVLEDPLPGALAWQLDGASSGCAISATTLTCDVGDLAADGSFGVAVSAPTTFAECATYPNTATATSSNHDPVSASAQIECHRPELTIEKSATPDTVNAGDPAGFSITVVNSGPGIARAVTIEDPLPGDLDWVMTLARSGCAISGATLTCDIGDLAPGADFTVAVEASTPAIDCGVLANTATALASNHPTVDDDAQITCLNPAIAIAKTADTEFGPPRDVTFSYLVTNTGEVLLAPVVVTDDILGEIGSIPSLDPGESATLTRTVAVDAQSPVRNVGTACGTPRVGSSAAAQVCADDDATISVVLGTRIVLPRTGMDIRIQILMAGLLLWLGAASMTLHARLVTRRRRSQS